MVHEVEVLTSESNVADEGGSNLGQKDTFLEETVGFKLR
jgi:hypothetical protein